MTAIANCARCGAIAPDDPFEDPHCLRCRPVIELVRWLGDLRDELAEFALLESRSLATRSDQDLDLLMGKRRRLQEWLASAEQTLVQRRLGGPLAGKLAVPVLAAPRTNEVLETLGFVIAEVLGRS